MKTTDFITSFNKKTLKSTKTTNGSTPKIFTPYEFQNEICSNFDNNRFIALQHSRQMGITTLLKFYICNFLFNNTNEKKTIYLKTISANGKHFIEEIRVMVNEYLVDMSNNFITNNSKHIKLTNGNEIKLLGNSLIGIDPTKTYSFIIDNAAFIDNINELIGGFINGGVNQILLTSSKTIKENQFYNTIFINQNSLFNKINIDWKLNPNFTSEWYDKTKRLYGDNVDMFNCEINLWDVKDTSTKVNKNRIINVRLTDDLLAKISNKLIEQDISLSEYLRNLINKDN